MGETFANVGGANKSDTIYRRPDLSVQLIHWDWDAGKPATDIKTGLETTELINLVLSFQWLKTIKNPAARCVISMLPQFGDTHYLNIISPMDVVKIYEFGTLKYMGFVTRIGASGEISPDSGKPTRTVSLYLSSFGELLVNGHLGVSLFLQASNVNTNNPNFLEIGTALNAAWNGIANLLSSESTYSQILSQIVVDWLNFVTNVGASKYVTYFNYFIDSDLGLVGQTIPQTPRAPFLFSSEDSDVTLMDILYKFAQMPFNELFMDCGPRTIYAEGDEYLSSVVSTDLNNEKEYIITRHTLFDGSIDDSGGKKDLWSSLVSVTLPISYLKRFDLNKSMEESYTFYLVDPALFDPGDYGLIADGDAVMDTDAFNKYLLREMHQQLFYDTFQSVSATSANELRNDKANVINTDVANKALMLKNWYANNDKFLSGTFLMEVPKDSRLDPRIGDKIDWDGISDAYFYVEGVAHSWTYGGELTSTLSVTRGFGNNGPIDLTNKIFKRGKFALGNGFS
jgi:hypothetical protein